MADVISAVVAKVPVAEGRVIVILPVFSAGIIAAYLPFELYIYTPPDLLPAVPAVVVSPNNNNATPFCEVVPSLTSNLIPLFFIKDEFILKCYNLNIYAYLEEVIK